MIHSTAIVEISEVDPTTNIWAFAHVMPGAQIGKYVNIGDHAFIEGGACLGDNVTVKNGVCVWDGIHIEDDVFVGPGVMFTNDRFPRSPRMEGMQERYAKPQNWLCRTHVGRGCSIGAAAVICPGIVLHPYSMVAAGAVVTKDVPEFSLVAGNPARFQAMVCRCGRRMSDKPERSTCRDCGEGPQNRNNPPGDL